MLSTHLRARRFNRATEAGDCAVPSVSVPSPEIDKSISTSPRGRGNAPSARTVTLPSPSGRGAGGEGASSGHSEARIAYAGQIIPDTSARRRESMPGWAARHGSPPSRGRRNQISWTAPFAGTTVSAFLLTWLWLWAVCFRQTNFSKRRSCPSKKGPDRSRALPNATTILGRRYAALACCASGSPKLMPFKYSLLKSST